MIAGFLDKIVTAFAPEAGVRRLAARQTHAHLASYAAAEKGRRNRDWRAPQGSADLSVIPDSIVLNARSRESVRNSWIARAGQRAKVRNVVGRGITPVPIAKDQSGKELTALNHRAETLFLRWASDKTACDQERRATFWRMQRRMAAEKFVVGEHLLVWSYRPNPKSVGLQLQGYEPEQLDTSIQNHEGNQVRGGVEIDECGAPVAYHLYDRNPYDYLGTRWKPIRVPACRVFHHFDAERVQQARGVTEMAPVLQDMRDFNSFREATLWRARMEACIGMIVKKATPGTGIPGMGPRLSGDAGTTPSGMRTFDMVPGMIAELAPGEDVVPYVPSSPGNQYDPFTTITLRGISAGMGMSRGSLTRESEANYSAARQDMLEDEREIGPEQDSLVDDALMPIYELWFHLAWLEGKFIDSFGRPLLDDAEYLADPQRFTEAEYVFPSRPWIDPEKEANAAEKLINLRIARRKEYISSRGGRFSSVVDQIAEERAYAASKGIQFPEDAAATASHVGQVPSVPSASSIETPPPPQALKPNLPHPSLPSPAEKVLPPGPQEGDPPIDQGDGFEPNARTA